MSRLSGGYQIGRQTRQCASSGRALATGEACVAVLLEGDKSEAPIRLDYSLEAWASGARPPAERLIGHWRTTVHEGEKKSKPLLDDDALADLFEQTGEVAGEGGEPTTAAAQRLKLRYVVCLMLLRRRLLTQEGRKGRVLLVRHKGTPRPPEGPPFIEVVDPDVDEGTLLEILGQLEGFGNEADTTGTAPPASQTPTTAASPADPDPAASAPVPPSAPTLQPAERSV
jgi:hypothetical protein